MAQISIDVDVELDDFDTDDLISEMKSRGYRVYSSDASSSDDELDAIYSALKINSTDRAFELMRAYVCDQLGRIL